MNTTITSSLIQDWFVINDDRWANVLTTGCVKGLQHSDADCLAAAA
jgi:hypothetical protein